MSSVSEKQNKKKKWKGRQIESTVEDALWHISSTQGNRETAYDKLSSVLDTIEQLSYHFYEEGEHIALRAKLLLKSSYIFCLTLLVNTVLLKDLQTIIFAIAPKLLRLYPNTV